MRSTERWRPLVLRASFTTSFLYWQGMEPECLEITMHTLTLFANTHTLTLYAHTQTHTHSLFSHTHTISLASTNALKTRGACKTGLQYSRIFTSFLCSLFPTSICSSEFEVRSVSNSMSRYKRSKFFSFLSCIH